MKPLDFVRTPKGNVALITETYTRNDGRQQASIMFIGHPNPMEHNAWHDEADLTVIDNLPRMMARGMRHPFGQGEDDAVAAFPGELV